MSEKKALTKEEKLKLVTSKLKNNDLGKLIKFASDLKKPTKQSALFRQVLRIVED